MKKILLLTFFVSLIMGNTNFTMSLDGILNKFLWKKRIVLLITDEKDLRLIDGVNSFFNEQICENRDRKIELYKIIGDQIKKYEVPEKYEGKKGIWLIGYDGANKAYSRDLSLLSQLYAIVDSMPIRQSEMVKQDSNCG